MQFFSLIYALSLCLASFYYISFDVRPLLVRMYKRLDTLAHPILHRLILNTPQLIVCVTPLLFLYRIYEHLRIFSLFVCFPFLRFYFFSAISFSISLNQLGIEKRRNNFALWYLSVVCICRRFMYRQLAFSKKWLHYLINSTENFAFNIIFYFFSSSNQIKFKHFSVGFSLSQMLTRTIASRKKIDKYLRSSGLWRKEWSEVNIKWAWNAWQNPTNRTTTGVQWILYDD